MENKHEEKDILNITNSLKEALKNNTDLVCRNLEIQGKKINILFLQDITSYDIISTFIIKPLTEVKTFPQSDVMQFIMQSVITGREIKQTENLQDAVTQILKGKTLVVIDEEEKVISVDSAKFATRGVEEPPTSSVLMGPREGFTESIKTNISLIRRRISTPDLIVLNTIVGAKTHTSVSVMYIRGVADKRIVDKVLKRIDKINIDGIVDSNYIAQYLQERKYSIFKQVGTTEKPDIVTSKLLEGRIAIFVDGSPMVLTIPFMLFENYQSGDDYYMESNHVTLIRWLRLFGSAFAVFLPGAYVALELYHYNIIPVKFLITIANTTSGLPFTPFLEVLFIIALFDLLTEASVRMPKYFGMSMSVVGALILGDTAVKAGLISPPAVIIVALSSIMLYLVNTLTTQISLLRIIFTFIGGTLGIYGIVLGAIYLVSYLSGMDSYNTPYIAPITPEIEVDRQDCLLFKRVAEMEKRPKSIPNVNPVRINNDEPPIEQSLVNLNEKTEVEDDNKEKQIPSKVYKSKPNVDK